MDEEQTPFKLSSVPVRPPSDDEPEERAAPPPARPIYVPERQVAAPQSQPQPEEPVFTPQPAPQPTPMPEPEVFVPRRQAAEPVHHPAATKARFTFPTLPQLSRKGLLIVVGIFVLLGGAVIWLAVSYQSALNKRDVAGAQAQADQDATTKQVEEDNAILAELKAYMNLPDEAPAFSTVTDVTKLQKQDFFKNAQNGDKVLIFQNNQRGLLYRPSTHKVIEYGKVVFSGPNP